MKVLSKHRVQIIKWTKSAITWYKTKVGTIQDVVVTDGHVGYVLLSDFEKNPYSVRCIFPSDVVVVSDEPKNVVVDFTGMDYLDSVEVQSKAKHIGLDCWLYTNRKVRVDGDTDLVDWLINWMANEKHLVFNTKVR